MWTGALSALPSSVPRHPEGVRFTPGIVSAVMQVTATLTIGTVTAGPHA